MRAFFVLRDPGGPLYAEDTKSTARYYFTRYPDLIDNELLRHLIADTFAADMRSFARWLNGEEETLLPLT